MLQALGQSLSMMPRLQTAAGPPPNPMLADLKGYYNLDEGGVLDDAIDYAGGMGSMFVWGTDAAPVTGPAARGARDVSGTGFKTFVDFEAFEGPPLSVNLWIKQTSSGGQYIFDATAATIDGTGGWTCFLAMDGGYCDMYCFNAGAYSSPGPINGFTFMDSVWTMLTLVWDGNTYAYYQDGVLLATDVFSTPVFDIGIAPFSISADFLPIQGAVCLFGVWGRALNQEQVTGLYNSGSGKAYNEL
jgi:hypothetical protein